MFERWRDFGFALLCAALAAFVALHPFDNPDFFWHLAVGRYVFEHGALPEKNLWSFTTPDHPFAATSWLFDWILFVLWRLGGMAAIHIAIALTASATFALTYLNCRLWGARAHWALGLTLSCIIISAFR